MKPLTIASSPLRLSIIGGGTDVPSVFNRLDYGFTISCALDLRLVVSITSLVSDNRIKLKYSRSEVVDSVADVIHPIIRTALLFFKYDPKVHGGIEITSTSPIPSGTGLGSSGAFTISLLGALYDHFYQSVPSKFELCERATMIERESGNTGIGFQDQYTSGFGDFLSLEYIPNTSLPILHPISESLYPVLSDFVSTNTFLVKCAQRSDLSGTHLSSLNQRSKIKALSSVAESAKSVFLSNLSHHSIFQQIIEAGNLSQSLKNVPSAISHLRNSLLLDKASYVKLLGAGGGGFLFVRLLDSISPTDINLPMAFFHKIRLSKSGFVLHQ